MIIFICNDYAHRSPLTEDNSPFRFEWIMRNYLYYIAVGHIKLKNIRHWGERDRKRNNSISNYDVLTNKSGEYMKKKVHLLTILYSQIELKKKISNDKTICNECSVFIVHALYHCSSILSLFPWRTNWKLHYTNIYIKIQNALCCLAIINRTRSYVLFLYLIHHNVMM